MGGFGSGRTGDFMRRTLDNCFSLDVNELHRNGRLHPGRGGPWPLRLGKPAPEAIMLRADVDTIHLSYRVRVGGAWQKAAQTVQIAQAACRFGGQRPYFICPGEGADDECGRRVAKLYQHGESFKCRHCCNLSYASQSEDVRFRAFRRALKIQRRLGGKTLFEPRPARPRGMWRSTYQSLCQQMDAALDEANKAFVEEAKRLDAMLSGQGIGHLVNPPSGDPDDDLFGVRSLQPVANCSRAKKLSAF